MVKIKKDASAEERILAAAQKVFISKGMAGARTQDIADEAGINKALLHYYFKNKQQLFEHVFAHVTHGFWEQITGIFESDTPLFRKIEQFCSVYIDKILENPYIPLFVLYEMNQRPAAFVKTIFRNRPPRPHMFIEQIAAEVKKGNIKRVQPAQLLMNMISMCLFPFIGKPVFMTVFNANEEEFRNMMLERKKEVPKFIIQSIKL